MSKDFIALQIDETVHWSGKPDYGRRRIVGTIAMIAIIFLVSEYLILQGMRIEGIRIIFAILLAINFFVIYSNAGVHYFVTNHRIVKERFLRGFARREEIRLDHITETRAKVVRGRGVLVFVRSEGFPLVFSYLKEDPEKIKVIALNAKRLLEDTRTESNSRSRDDG